MHRGFIFWGACLERVEARSQKRQKRIQDKKSVLENTTIVSNMGFGLVQDTQEDVYEPFSQSY